MHPRSRGLASILLGAAVAAGVSADAHAQASRVDAWAAAGTSRAGTGEVVTQYVPELRFFDVDQGSGGQTVTVDSGARFASELGIDVFFNDVVGLEVWFARDTLEPTGTSSTYDTSLRYVSRPPPSHDPVVVDYARTDPWGPVSTAVRRRTTALNGVIRWGAQRTASGTISGGLAFVRTSGEVTPLGYTMFVLGGHSTLFPNEYRLTAAIEPTTEIRANLGATLDLRLARHAAVSFALRQVLGAETTSTLRVTAVDRSTAGFDPPTPEDITAQLSASTVSLPTASTRAMVGIKLRF